MALLMVAMTLAPSSGALYGFFVVAPAVGIGALGATLRADGWPGRLGRAFGWAAALGGVAVVALSVYAVATGQFTARADVADEDPLAVPFMLTSTVWMLGSLGVALALARDGSIPALGGWLVLVGTATGIGLGTLLGAVAPQLSPLPALPFAIGWVVVGWHTRRSVRAHRAEVRASATS